VLVHGLVGRTVSMLHGTRAVLQLAQLNKLEHDLFRWSRPPQHSPHSELHWAAWRRHDSLTQRRLGLDMAQVKRFVAASAGAFLCSCRNRDRWRLNEMSLVATCELTSTR
jgi:hypothetical protein